MKKASLSLLFIIAIGQKIYSQNSYHLGSGLCYNDSLRYHINNTLPISNARMNKRDSIILVMNYKWKNTAPFLNSLIMSWPNTDEIYSKCDRVMKNIFIPY
jgi:hypothetical protein